MLQPGSLLSRTLAVLLLGLVVFAGYRLIVVSVIAAWQNGERAIVESQALLQRYRALAEQRSFLAESLAEQEQQAATADGYLAGPSAALAAAQLQDRVKTVVESAGGELLSAQVLPAAQVEGNPRVHRAALKVQFAVTIDGLATTLYELETGQPYLIVNALSIRQQPMRQLGDEPQPQPWLDVRLELFGYLRDVRPERTRREDRSIALPPDNGRGRYPSPEARRSALHIAGSGVSIPELA